VPAATSFLESVDRKEERSFAGGCPIYNPAEKKKIPCQSKPFSSAESVHKRGEGEPQAPGVNTQSSAPGKKRKGRKKKKPPIRPPVAQRKKPGSPKTPSLKAGGGNKGKKDGHLFIIGPGEKRRGSRDA